MQNVTFVHASLVNLINKDVRDAGQRRVVAQPTQQHARGAEQQPRGDAARRLQAHRVADGGADGLAALGSDARRDGLRGEAARLRDDDVRVFGMFQQERGQLRGLAAARFAGDDHNAVRSDGGQEGGAARRHGQRGAPRRQLRRRHGARRQLQLRRRVRRTPLRRHVGVARQGRLTACRHGQRCRRRTQCQLHRRRGARAHYHAARRGARGARVQVRPVRWQRPRLGHHAHGGRAAAIHVREQAERCHHVDDARVVLRAPVLTQLQLRGVGVGLQRAQALQQRRCVQRLLRCAVPSKSGVCQRRRSTRVCAGCQRTRRRRRRVSATAWLCAMRGPTTVAARAREESQGMLTRSGTAKTGQDAPRRRRRRRGGRRRRRRGRRGRGRRGRHYRGS
jgi:hypothetical protein